MIGVLSGPTVKAQLGLIVTRQVRLQGITVGNGDGFEAMSRAIAQHRLRQVLDRDFGFDELRRPTGRSVSKGPSATSIPPTLSAITYTPIYLPDVWLKLDRMRSASDVGCTVWWRTK